MYNIKVPKEIRDYKDKVLGGFTIRQLISLFFTSLVGAPVFYESNKLFGMDAAGWCVIVVTMPIIAIGFYKKENMPLEKYIIKYIKFQFLYPKKRVYADQNFYKKIVNYQNKKESCNILRRVKNVLQKNKTTSNGK